MALPSTTSALPPGRGGLSGKTDQSPSTSTRADNPQRPCPLASTHSVDPARASCAWPLTPFIRNIPSPLPHLAPQQPPRLGLQTRAPLCPPHKLHQEDPSVQADALCWAFSQPLGLRGGEGLRDPGTPQLPLSRVWTLDPRRSALLLTAGKALTLCTFSFLI